MKRIAILLAAMAMAACSEPAQAPPPDAHESMEMAAPEAAGPIQGMGVIAALGADTVTIQHEPIEAVGWSAMTMRFDAAPALLQGLAVGDQVMFELESAENPRTVTSITKQ